MNDNRDTPRRTKLAMAVEEAGNGHVPTPRRVRTVPIIAVEEGNGSHDSRRDDDPPFREPRTPLEIAANCASEAKAAALHASGMAGEAFGAAARTEAAVKMLDAKVDRLALDVGGIAKAVGAKRTFSGQVRVSLPPDTPPIAIHTTRSDTGEHNRISDAELERLSRRFADLEAEERGAKLALAERESDDDRRARKWKERREIAVAVVLIVTPLAGALLWALKTIH